MLNLKCGPSGISNAQNTLFQKRNLKLKEHNCNVQTKVYMKHLNRIHGEMSLY
jgi:hypothetical protein